MVKKELSHLKYWDVYNLYGWTMLQNLPLNKFESIEDAFHFNEDSIKNYNEESSEGYFLEIVVRYSEKLYELRNDLPFLAERMKFEKVRKLVANLPEKK